METGCSVPPHRQFLSCKDNESGHCERDHSVRKSRHPLARCNRHGGRQPVSLEVVRNCSWEAQQAENFMCVTPAESFFFMPDVPHLLNKNLCNHLTQRKETTLPEYLAEKLKLPGCTILVKP